MPLGGLQHYTIEPQDLERTKDFYVDVLGLEIGDRPPLDFPGYWLYSGGQATVHLMGTRKPREGIVVRGTEKKYEDTGRLDHMPSPRPMSTAMRKRLQAQEREIPREHRAAHRRHAVLSLRSRRRRRGVEFPEVAEAVRAAFHSTPIRPACCRPNVVSAIRASRDFGATSLTNAEVPDKAATQPSLGRESVSV